jgi:cyanophycinase
MKVQLKLLALTLLVVFCSIIATSSQTGSSTSTDSYQIWRLGATTNIQVNSTKGGVAMIGGGPDCDDAFKYMVGNSNGGDFVVLRASGDDAYNPYIMDISNEIDKPLNSVTTILFLNRLGSYEDEVIKI